MNQGKGSQKQDDKTDANYSKGLHSTTLTRTHIQTLPHKYTDTLMYTSTRTHTSTYSAIHADA